MFEENVIRELLPIGSVVLLKGGTKRLMVIGVKQTEEDGTDYDYLGVVYPEGYVNDEFRFLFNQQDINRVDFWGFQDKERDEFLDKLVAYYQDDE